MLVPVTALYGAILTLVLVALAINVTLHRRKLRVGLGNGSNPVMLRMVRIHGNAVEYIPSALLLMLVYELNGGAHTALHLCGCALILGRVLHAAGLWNSDGQSFGRTLGQSLTWLTLLALAALNLSKVL
ncbi:MAG: MAPEG family protein [Steroidobacteraceae bacterium]